jgi:hypothetical protein
MPNGGIKNCNAKCLLDTTRTRAGGKWSPESIAVEMAKLREERDHARGELERLRGRL